jgi:hypothetical protein
MTYMITTTTPTESRAEQLTLLPSATVPARFLLSRETRERGLRHVAEIRRMLAERSDASVSSLPARDVRSERGDRAA